jgi:hypothetical protein
LKLLVVGIIGAVLIALFRVVRTYTDLNEEGAKTSMNNFVPNPGTTNFKLSEFHCNDGTKVPLEYYGNLQKLMENLEYIRTYFGNNSIVITSGYRSPKYNATISGAAKNSMHLTASAADFIIDGFSPITINKGIKDMQSRGVLWSGGNGLYYTFNHYDIGTARNWKG